MEDNMQNFICLGNDCAIVSTNPNKRIIPFVIGLVVLVAFFMFEYLMIRLNAIYIKSNQTEMNFFKVLSWAMSGKAGILLVGSWLISIVQTILFSVCSRSSLFVIKLCSIIFLIISLLTFTVPIIALIVLW